MQSESKAQTYGIAAFCLAVVNVVLGAALLFTLFRLDKPLAFAENHPLAMFGSAVVALTLVFTVVILILAIESLNASWKTQARGSVAAIVAFIVGAVFAATFTSFGSLAVIEHLRTQVGQEEAVSETPRERFVRHWEGMSCSFLREFLGFVHEVGEWQQSPDRTASGGQAQEGERTAARLMDRPREASKMNPADSRIKQVSRT